MEPKDPNQEIELTTQQGERMLKSPNSEPSIVAQEIYPENTEKQDEFIEDFNKFLMVVGGGKCADLILKDQKITTKQVERIAYSPKKEAEIVAKEIYPNNKRKQIKLKNYIFENFI